MGNEFGPGVVCLELLSVLIGVDWIDWTGGPVTVSPMRILGLLLGLFGLLLVLFGGFHVVGTCWDAYERGLEPMIKPLNHLREQFWWLIPLVGHPVWMIGAVGFVVFSAGCGVCVWAFSLWTMKQRAEP